MRRDEAMVVHHLSSSTPFPMTVHLSRILSAMVACLLVGACAEQEEYRVAKLLDPQPTPASFKACYGNSCRLHGQVHLSPDQWEQVRAVFEPPPADALAERRAVEQAIAVLER